MWSILDRICIIPILNTVWLGELKLSNSLQFPCAHFFYFVFYSYFLLLLLLCVIDPVGSPSTEKIFHKKCCSAQLNSLYEFNSFYLTRFSLQIHIFSFTHSLAWWKIQSRPVASHTTLFPAQHSTVSEWGWGNLITVCRELLYIILHIFYTHINSKVQFFIKPHMCACTKYVIRFQFFLILMCLCRCFSDHCALYTHTVSRLTQIHADIGKLSTVWQICRTTKPEENEWSFRKWKFIGKNEYRSKLQKFTIFYIIVCIVLHYCHKKGKIRMPERDGTKCFVVEEKARRALLPA